MLDLLCGALLLLAPGIDLSFAAQDPPLEMMTYQLVLLKKGPTPQEEISKELEAGNAHGLRFLLPEQGEHWHF